MHVNTTHAQPWPPARDTPGGASPFVEPLQQSQCVSKFNVKGWHVAKFLRSAGLWHILLHHRGFNQEINCKLLEAIDREPLPLPLAGAGGGGRFGIPLGHQLCGFVQVTWTGHSWPPPGAMAVPIEPKNAQNEWCAKKLMKPKIPKSQKWTVSTLPMFKHAVIKPYRTFAACLKCGLYFNILGAQGVWNGFVQTHRWASKIRKDTIYIYIHV